jgi:uncharacterized protein YdeI (YjbR/CyaY-like superfamily)
MKKTNAASRADSVPGELLQALAADPWVRDYFERLPPSHRRKYAEWVAEAKKKETRARRAARALEMLRARMSRK